MKKQKQWEVKIKKTRQTHRRTLKSPLLATLKKTTVSQTLQMDSSTQFQTRMNKTVRTERICRVEEAVTDVQQLWRIVKKLIKRTQTLLDLILLLHSDIMTLVVVEVDEAAVVEDVAVEEATKTKDEVTKVDIKIVVEIITTKTTIVEVGTNITTIVAVGTSITTIVAVGTRIEAEEVVIRMIVVVVMEEVEADMLMEEMIIQKVNGDLIIGEAMEEIAIGKTMEEIATGKATEEIATEEITKEVVLSRADIQAEVAMVVSSMARERP